MSTPTAAWDAPALVQTLGRGGWLDLDGKPGGGLRQTLYALVSLLPHGSAEGRITAAQVADAAGLSVRWTRRCLHVLEDLGLIVWHRGGVIDGRPRPGWVRIIKTALASMARRARGSLANRQRQRQRETRQRLAGLKSPFICNQTRRKPLSTHAELSSPLPFLKGGTAPGSLPPPAQLPLDGGDMHHHTPCQVCGRLPEHCAKANRRIPFDLGHRYHPTPPRSHQLVADPHPVRTDERPAPTGWRGACRDPQRPLIEDGGR